MNNQYKEQVRLLLRMIPLIYGEERFAIHGGTAINLFLRDLPRYSVDIDLTYIPLESREDSLRNINEALRVLGEKIKRAIPNIIINPVPNKLLCILNRCAVKIEVNGIKRGIIDKAIIVPLCTKAQEEFNIYCKARIVPVTQLYGGKIAAALSRQHPRDLFDFKYMEIADFKDLKYGFIFCLLGSDKPILESLSPHLIDQSEALRNQFMGMTDTLFTYEDYQHTRLQLIELIHANLTESDKCFLLNFENGEPNWHSSEYEDFKNYPSIQWKQLNIKKLKDSNLKKLKQETSKLAAFFEYL